MSLSDNDALSYDPYDLWTTDLGVRIRRAFYQGKTFAKLGAAAISLADLLAPLAARRLLRISRKRYPILSAHLCLTLLESDDGASLGTCKAILADLARQAVSCDAFVAWGLGFPWMSKNGLYGPDVPFVTHTPYVMEALLALAAKQPELRGEALRLFHDAWGFLESLIVMHEDEETLALSYAPVKEPRIVVNANAYAAFAYALHAVHGIPERHETAKVKAMKLVRWGAQQQQADGSWWYYADNQPGNFIDCFHSCFVVKNLLKVSRLLPEMKDEIHPVAEKGWAYIRTVLYDDKNGLCRRFAVRSHRDPFRWDLYDQAEYLGLLIDFGLIEEAEAFARRVEARFRKREHWYCRIDLFGRRWGRDFLRWGIAPFWYHRARLARAWGEEACAAS